MRVVPIFDQLVFHSGELELLERDGGDQGALAEGEQGWNGGGVP